MVSVNVLQKAVTELSVDLLITFWRRDSSEIDEEIQSVAGSKYHDQIDFGASFLCYTKGAPGEYPFQDVLFVRDDPKIDLEVALCGALLDADVRAYKTASIPMLGTSLVQVDNMAVGINAYTQPGTKRELQFLFVSLPEQRAFHRMKLALRT